MRTHLGEDLLSNILLQLWHGLLEVEPSFVACASHIEELGGKGGSWVLAGMSLVANKILGISGCLFLGISALAAYR